MKKTMLIILSYQREIPPFMLNEIKIAKDLFDEVVYITPYLYNDNSQLVNYPNVSVRQGLRGDRIKGIMGLPFSFLKVMICKEIIKAFKWKRISKENAKSFMQYLGASNFLAHKAGKIIENNKDKKIFVLAAWMGGEAYATSKLKIKYKEIYAATLAHSCEVDLLKNINVDLRMNKFVHQTLDNINFISTNVYASYHAYAMKKYNLEAKNITFHHLGCEKLLKVLNKPSEDGVFRIFTCSTVYPHKRVDRLLKVAENWREGKIVWTHIGDGANFQKIKQAAEEVMNKNPLAKIEMLGSKSNKEVHQYFAESSVDIFLNISTSEGLPVSLMECMAYGVPAVATDVGGNKEIVNAGNGYLIPSEFSDEKLLEILREYSRLDAEKVRTYRDNAFTQWKTNFDAEKNITGRYKMMLKAGGS